MIKMLAMFLVFAGVQVSTALAASGEIAVFFIPRVATEVFIPVELVRSRDARSGVEKMEKLLRKDFRPLAPQDKSEFYGKCIVEKNQHSREFLVECWSVPLWRGDPGLEEVSRHRSEEEVLAQVRSFSDKHAKRARESFLKREKNIRKKSGLIVIST